MNAGLIAGCFDPFPHPGILMSLESAVRYHNLSGVIVCLHTRPNVERPEKAEPQMTILERTVRAIRYVDEIHPYDTESDLLVLLQTLTYDVRILGDDYRDRDYTGIELNKPAYYAQRYHGWSATEFRKRLSGA